MRLLIYFLSAILCLGISWGYAKPSANGVDDSYSLAYISNQLDLLKSGNENLKLRLDMMEHNFEKQRQNHNDIQRKFLNIEDKLDRLQDRQEKHHNELKELLGSLMMGNQCEHDQSEFPLRDDKTELLIEMEKVAKQQEKILTKLDAKCETTGISSTQSLKVDGQGAGNETIPVEGVNVCGGIYTKILGELNSNLTILQNVDTKLDRIYDLYTADKRNKSIEIPYDLLTFLNKKDSKICVKSNDEKLTCTGEPYPSSCADYAKDSSHCSNNKCRIKNAIYGPETFLVACDEISDGGGWTVIQRRINGSVDFYRDWSEYKTGFGNLDGEFWIGLDKLHALTTTLAPVELLIQLKDHEGVMKYAKYGKFAIGSEEELYELKEAGDYEGNAGDAFSLHKGFKFTTKDKDNDIDTGYNCAVTKSGAWWYRKCCFSNLNGLYYKTNEVPELKETNGLNWKSFHGYKYSLKFVQMMIRTKKS